jgi:hypothetical protein
LGPEVEHFVAFLAKGLGDFLLEVEAGVVGRDDNVHRPPTLVCCPESFI